MFPVFLLKTECWLYLHINYLVFSSIFLYDINSHKLAFKAALERQIPLDKPTIPHISFRGT